MRILYVYKDYAPVLGGIENHVRTLAEGLVQAGHQVTVLACDPGPVTRRETLCGVEVIKAGRLTTAASMPLSLAQARFLIRQRPDVVHIHSPYPLGELTNWLLGRGRVTIITHHSDIVRQRGWLRLYAPLLRRVLAAADRILVDSPPYIETSPWLQPVRHKCQAVPIGIDVQRFTPPARRSGAGTRLLFVGRLRYYKGLDTLLQAMVFVPEARLELVGDGPLRAELELQSQALGLQDRVDFVGEVDDAHLPGYYRQADVFVLPSNSRAEAYGIVLLEAMASGLPCITTELGTGTSWIVRHGVTGLVVPPNDPRALAGAIRRLLQDPDRHRAMGAAGRRRVEQEFTVGHMLRRIEAIYRETLAEKEAAGGGRAGRR